MNARGPAAIVVLWALCIGCDDDSRVVTEDMLPEAPPELQLEWDTLGSNPGQSIAVDPSDGSLFSAKDRTTRVYDPDGQLQFSWDTERELWGITVAGNKLYATTAESDASFKVRIYILDGTLISEWGPFGERGLARAIDVNSRGDVYVASINGVYYITSEGHVRNVFGFPDPEESEEILDLAVATEGSVDRVFVLYRRYGKDGSFSAIIRVFTKYWWSAASFENRMSLEPDAEAVGLDSEGDVYVAGQLHLRKYTPDGDLLTKLDLEPDSGGLRAYKLAVGPANTWYVEGVKSGRFKMAKYRSPSQTP